jgi:hypothetical protein
LIFLTFTTAMSMPLLIQASRLYLRDYAAAPAWPLVNVGEADILARLAK